MGVSAENRNDKSWRKQWVVAEKTDHRNIYTELRLETMNCYVAPHDMAEWSSPKWAGRNKQLNSEGRDLPMWCRSREWLRTRHETQWLAAQQPTIRTNHGSHERRPKSKCSGIRSRMEDKDNHCPESGVGMKLANSSIWFGYQQWSRTCCPFRPQFPQSAPTTQTLVPHTRAAGCYRHTKKQVH